MGGGKGPTDRGENRVVQRLGIAWLVYGRCWCCPWPSLCVWWKGETGRGRREGEEVLDARMTSRHYIREEGDSPARLLPGASLVPCWYLLLLVPGCLCFGLGQVPTARRRSLMNGGGVFFSALLPLMRLGNI